MMNVFYLTADRFRLPDKTSAKYEITLFRDGLAYGSDDLFITDNDEDFKRIRGLTVGRVIVLCENLPENPHDRGIYVLFADAEKYLEQVINLLLELRQPSGNFHGNETVSPSESEPRFYGHPSSIDAESMIADSLRNSDKNINAVFSRIHHAYTLIEKNKSAEEYSSDYVFIEANDAFIRLFGLDDGFRGERVKRLLPELAGFLPDHSLKKPEYMQAEKTDSGKRKFYRVALYPAGPERLALMYVDITGRMEMEINLQKSDEKYRKCVESIPISVFITDTAGKILYANRAAENMTGYDDGKLENLSVFDLIRDEDFRSGLMMNNGNRKGEFIMMNSGDEALDILYETVRFDESSFLTFCIDVTEQKNIQKEIEKKEKLLTSLFDNTYTSIMLLSLDGRIISINKKTVQTTGLEPEEFLGEIIWETGPWKFDESVRGNFMHNFIRSAEGEFVHFKTEVLGSGGILHFDVSLNPVFNMSGRIDFIIAEQHDISDIYRFESELREIIDQKDVLLKEIHHRVKNNMQIILSLLNMQSRFLTDERDRAVFLESQNRIKVMALVYEKIYQSKNLSEIDYSQYVHELVDYYDANFADSYKIMHDIEITGISLKVDEAIPVSLILNEILTNSFKYAFNGIPEDDRSKFKIMVRMTQNGDECLLEVNDNGCGIDNEDSFFNGTSLGFRLIRGLVQQLKGSVDFSAAGGCSYLIRIPLPKKNE